MKKDYKFIIIKDTINCWFRLMLYRIILNNPIELRIVYYTSKFLYHCREQVGKGLWFSNRNIMIVNWSTHYHFNDNRNIVVKMRLIFKNYLRWFMY